MRKIAEIVSDVHAATYVRILRGHGIKAEVREGGGVWVLDDNDLSEASALLGLFFHDPSNPALFEAARAGDALAAEEHTKDAQWRRRVRAARTSVHGVGAAPWVTRAIALAAVVVTLLTGFGQTPRLYAPLLLSDLPAFMGLRELMRGEVWRLFTPGLLHFSVMHLGFNLLAWIMFGAQIERRKGSAHFLWLALLTDAGGFLLQWLIGYAMAPRQVVVAGGLSGMIYGLFGYVLIKGWLDPLDRLDVDSQTTWMMGAWLLLGFTGMAGGIANGAHVGGFVVGCLFALGDMAWFRWRKR